MKPRDRLKHLLRDVPEEEKDAAALRFIRYLEIVIEISEGQREKSRELTDEEEPPTLSYSI